MHTTRADVGSAPSDPSQGQAWRLTLLFASLSFLQSLAEPTEGLPAQPVRSLLRAGGKTVSEITTFVALMALPWLIKPLFGLISDFFPVRGSRRKSYLLISSAVAVLAFAVPFASSATLGTNGALLGWLTLAT